MMIKENVYNFEKCIQKHTLNTVGTFFCIIFLRYSFKNVLGYKAC